VGGNCELTNYELVKHMLALMADITGKGYTMASNVALVRTVRAMTGAMPWTRLK